MHIRVSTPAQSNAVLQKLRDVRINRVELALDISQPDRVNLGIALYVWSETGLVRLHGDAYRGLPRHDFPTVVATSIAPDAIALEEKYRSALKCLEVTPGILRCVGELWRSEAYAGSAAFLPEGTPVESVAGILLLIGSQPLVIMASDYEPSLEVFTSIHDVSSALLDTTRLVALW